jgi:flavin-dependent dehydrogenase
MMMLADTHFDVAIIGAGPAGSSCAALLARKGVKVLLCDKAAFPREKICGDCINPRSWAFFNLLGIDKEVAGNSEVIDHVKISARSGNVLSIPVERILRARSLSASIPTPFIAMKRSKLDSILLQRAVFDGATFLELTTLESIGRGASTKEGWKLSLKTVGKGDSFVVYCSTIVGADGRNSRVAHLLAEDEGGNISAAKGDSSRVGVQFLVSRPDAVARNVTMFFFGEGYGGIVGVNAGEANVAMVTTQKLAHLAATDFDNFIGKTIHANQFMRRSFPLLTLAGNVHSAYPITPRINNISKPNAFLVGDARHTTEPFTGQGIYFAIQDGVMAAARLSRTLGFARDKRRISPKSHFMADRVYSPILRGGKWVETLLNIGVRFDSVARMVAKGVLG